MRPSLTQFSDLGDDRADAFPHYRASRQYLNKITGFMHAMLITDEDILPRFLEHLSWATEIDLATAWATSNQGLSALCQQVPSLEVRAVVGLWGNLTDPFALRMLAKNGQLRGADAGRRFHPKVFIFRGGGKSVAWVGSANFTSGGFAMNEEALFETSVTESVQHWFDDLWEYCDLLDDAAIDAYAESRKVNPPPPPPRPPNTLELDPLQMLEGVGHWRSYVEALDQCDGWWSNRHSWSVLGDQGSWRETVEVLHDVISHPDWGELDQNDRLRLLGLTPGADLALLGRMRPTSLKTVFGTKRETIQKIVHAVAAAEDDAFPQLAFDSYKALWDIYGVGPGIATRLLTIARPDRFVSLNNASKDGLAAFFGFAPSTLGEPRNYARLLTAIYNQNWCRRPAPRNARERAISRMRTALLDCFVYDTENAG